MALISWDIGINNLSYCILDKDGNIIKWDVIDLMKDIKAPVEKCCGILKNKKQCSKTASLSLNDNKYCKTHCKDVSAKPINQKDCCVKNKNGSNCKMKVGFKLNDTFYCKKHKPDNAVKDITVDNISFFERNKLLPQILDKIDGIHNVKKVLIESQPVHKNPIMKSIQMLLYSYYLIRDVVDKQQIDDIILINATNKLTIYDGPEIECEIKDTHAKNKFLGKKYCEYFLKDNKEKMEYFMSHKKRDDLADSYLQGLYYIKKNAVL